ncbi:MAG TPA: putative metalloprotease CJM1_0395 family protein, partial [Polyangiaceae bacterium]|nr:putative metalloprotease CJM1_0395 family protein [Polyangiaceae bacterium]
NTTNGTHVPDAALLASAIPPAPQGSGSAASEEDANPDHNLQEQAPSSSSDLEQFRERVAEVRAKERTHQQLAGPYAGNSQFDYQTGPDGQRYAVSGSTPVDVEPVANNPEATLHKMEVVQQAAGAPANASDGNRQLALLTAQRAGQARAQLAARRYADAQRLAPASTENA